MRMRICALGVKTRAELVMLLQEVAERVESEGDIAGPVPGLLSIQAEDPGFDIEVTAGPSAIAGVNFSGADVVSLVRSDLVQDGFFKPAQIESAVEEGRAAIESAIRQYGYDYIESMIGFEGAMKAACSESGPFSLAQAIEQWELRGGTRNSFWSFVGDCETFSSFHEQMTLVMHGGGEVY